MPRPDRHGQEPGRHADVVFGREPGRGAEPAGARQPQDGHALARRISQRARRDQVAGLVHPAQERDVLTEPGIIEQGSAHRRRRSRPVQQRDPRVPRIFLAPTDGVAVALQDHRPAVVVLLARGGGISEDLPAGVLQPDQCLSGRRGEGDRDMTSLLGRLAGMPGKGHRVGRLPLGDRSPDGRAPVGGRLDDLAAGEGHRGAVAEDAQLGQRPPPAQPGGEHVERGRRVRVHEYFPPYWR